MAQSLDLGELQVNPSLVTSDEDTLALLGCLGGRRAGIVAVETDPETQGTNAKVDGSQVGALARCFRGVFAKALAMSAMRLAPIGGE